MCLPVRSPLAVWELEYVRYCVGVWWQVPAAICFNQALHKLRIIITAAMRTKTYLFDPRPEYPFLLSIKQYQFSTPDSGFPNDATLILTHGTGFHKEQWEPTLDHLHNLERQRGGFRIREAWSIDCPNHGDSATLNEDTLVTGCYDEVCD